MSASPAPRLDVNPFSTGSRAANSQREEGNVRRLRLLKRQRVNVAALAETADGVFAVEIKNISQTGAGVLSANLRAHHNAITLHFRGGRAVTAHVRWRRLGFCGVEFETPLAFDDPILPGLDPSAGAHKTAQLPPVQVSVSKPIQILMRAGRRFKNALLRFAGRLHARLKARAIWHQLRCHQRTIEAACRKQGFAWLTDPETRP